VTLRTALPAALLVALALAGCAEPTSGPARVVWGRHACDHCGMAISEIPFAAQVRTGPRDVARFDDFGCAVLWMEAHGGAAAAVEIWAMDSEGGAERWLDARRASYRPGQRTPMAYGFAAVGEAAPGTVDFERARLAVLEHEHGRDPVDRP
jgi:nitrous oxide reductase accessory protein NosL